MAADMEEAEMDWGEAMVVLAGEGGNEKGGVEGLVKFSRENFLVPIPEVASLEV